MQRGTSSSFLQHKEAEMEGEDRIVTADRLLHASVFPARLVSVVKSKTVDLRRGGTLRQGIGTPSTFHPDEWSPNLGSTSCGPSNRLETSQNRELEGGRVDTLYKARPGRMPVAAGTSFPSRPENPKRTRGGRGSAQQA